ncbi:MAG TPA: hypothetical protein VFK66_00490 [Oryzihumus sp.]|nr:hypothetical protein [Oryzihumus sp.]
MDEPEFDRELQALLDGRLPRAASIAQPPSSLPPAVVALRAVNISEPLVGHRARFQMTSYGEHGEWLDYGWRDGMRIVSEPTEVDGLSEAGVWVQEEADYYRTIAGNPDLPRFAAGISRLWVEQYVSQEALGQPGSGRLDTDSTDPWLAEVVSDPNAPRINRPVPAREVHSFIGRRAIAVDDEGRYRFDLRIADQPTYGEDRRVYVSVVDESDWFLWSARKYTGRHPSMTSVLADQLWIEC